jgi:hypothetical protein
MDMTGAVLLVMLGASLAVCIDEMFAVTPVIAAFLSRFFR